MSEYKVISGHLVTVVMTDGININCSGPDREANARKFMHMDELINAISKYVATAEVHLEMNNVGSATILRVQNEKIRTILAKIKGGTA
jgi:hypothetical protein